MGIKLEEIIIIVIIIIYIFLCIIKIIISILVKSLYTDNGAKYQKPTYKVNF